MDREIAIRLNDVTLLLPVKRGAKPHPDSELGEQWVGGKLGAGKRNQMTVTALSHFSAVIHKGDRIGLIGHNGAGKSSLLRVMAGIYYPTSGRCESHGKISTLFTNSLGFNADATGMENIIISGLTLGLSRKEIDKVIPDILDFSELGDFMHLPVRTYSSGMRTRLGFSVATSVNPNILLIDEVFGAGDRRFQRKARARMNRVLDKANTLVMASHSGELIEQFCKHVMWLEHGSLRDFGPVKRVLPTFYRISDREAAKKPPPPAPRQAAGDLAT